MKIRKKVTKNVSKCQNFQYLIYKILVKKKKLTIFEILLLIYQIIQIMKMFIFHSKEKYFKKKIIYKKVSLQKVLTFLLSSYD